MSTRISIESDRLRTAISRCADLEQLATVLAALMSSDLDVWRDGLLLSIRAQVERIRNLVLHIFPHDHAPPHFHVLGPDIDAKFDLNDGSLIGGSIDRREARLVKAFFQHGGRAQLVAEWERMHPHNASS